jgi:hypothetical protein
MYIARPVMLTAARRRERPASVMSAGAAVGAARLAVARLHRAVCGLACGGPEIAQAVIASHAPVKRGRRARHVGQTPRSCRFWAVSGVILMLVA